MGMTTVIEQVLARRLRERRTEQLRAFVEQTLSEEQSVHRTLARACAAVRAVRGDEGLCWANQRRALSDHYT